MLRQAEYADNNVEILRKSQGLAIAFAGREQESYRGEAEGAVAP